MALNSILKFETSPSHPCTSGLAYIFSLRKISDKAENIGKCRWLKQASADLFRGST